MTEQAQTKRPGWLKRQFVVNEHFQYRFVLFAGMTGIVACTFFYAVTTYFFFRYHQMALDVGINASNPFFKVLANMQTMLTVFFAGTTLAIIAFSTIAGLIFSNRVAGPLYRMREHFEKVSRGETLGGVSFREGDYFDDLAEAYNRQMDYIRPKIDQSKLKRAA